MKHKLIAVIVVAVLLATAGPALAKGSASGHGGGDQIRHQLAREAFALVGTITALGADTITIDLQSGNRRVKPQVGQDLTVQVTATTRYMRWTANGSVPITFADLGVGDAINVNGVVNEGVYTATRVTIDIPMYCPGH